MFNFYNLSWVPILVSVAALIVSIVTYMKSSKRTQGQVELQIRELIFQARRHLSEMTVACCNDDGKHKEEFQKILSSAYEDFLNSYDEACKKYLDKKVDQTSFKQMYADEIRQLAESYRFKEHSGPQTRFRYILRVYEEWRA